MAINDNQYTKPYSLPHIQNMGFDPEFQVPIAETLKYDPSGAVVREVADELATRLDDTTTSDVTYVGYAPMGSATSSNVWRIMKMDESSGLAITWADGDAEFDNVWDNRASLTYT